MSAILLIAPDMPSAQPAPLHLNPAMGVAPDAPETEEARQAILKSCLANRVVCAISVNTKTEIDRRIKEGWRMIRTGRGE